MAHVVLIRPHVILTPIEGGKISQALSEALSAHPASDGRDSIGVHIDPEHKHDMRDDSANILK